jgi:hypothetical protein
MLEVLLRTQTIGAVMKELTAIEVDEVSGARISASEGALALIVLGASGPVGWATAAAMGIGLGLSAATIYYGW